MFTQENLAEKSNAELVAIVVSLGGVAPRKFRTKADGIAKVLELQGLTQLREPAQELVSESKLERLERLRDAATDPALIRKLRKKIRRITQPAARARRAHEVFVRRTATSKRNAQRAAKVKAA